MSSARKCLETRRREDGSKWRRYRTEDGRTFTTVEIPETVFRGAVNPKQYARRMEAWQRGEAQRARDRRMRERIAQGIKPLAIAHELGLSVRHVERTRREEQLRRQA